jgi:hypothetical protein
MSIQYFLHGEPLEVIQKLERGVENCTYLVKKASNQFICKHLKDLPGETPLSKEHRFKTEIESYERLRETKIKIPELLEANTEHHYLITEYIEGDLISDLVSCGAMTTEIFMKAFEFSEDLKAHDINLDYFPSNFVVRNGEIYYIDYEVNAYIDEWDFTHWGIYYWLNQEGMKLFNDTDQLDLLHPNQETPKPRTLGFEHTVAELRALYQHSVSRK